MRPKSHHQQCTCSIKFPDLYFEGTIYMRLSEISQCENYVISGNLDWKSQFVVGDKRLILIF